MLIEKYMPDAAHRDMFRKFAIEDIMEMTSYANGKALLQKYEVEL